MNDKKDSPFQLFSSSRAVSKEENAKTHTSDASSRKDTLSEGRESEEAGQNNPPTEVDLVHSIVRISPLLEKFLAHSIASANKRIEDLQARVEGTDPHTQDRLCDRFGPGNEWRGLADEHLLAIYACITKLEMQVDAKAKGSKENQERD